MARVVLFIAFLLLPSVSWANEAHALLYERWAIAVDECRGGIDGGDGYDTERACGRRDAYLDALLTIGACQNDDPDEGCVRD